jgi:hypothetical protein
MKKSLRIFIVISIMTGVRYYCVFGWKVLFLAYGSMTRVDSDHLKWTPWSCVGKRRMHNPKKNPDLVFLLYLQALYGEA